MNIPKEMIANSVQHRYAGNGWAVVETYPDNWSRITYVGKGEVGHQFFLVWGKLLGMDRELVPDIITKINAIRQDLASGKKIIKDTRLVPA